MLKTVRNLLQIGLKTGDICRIDQHRNIKRWVAPTLRELQRRKDKLGPEKEEPRSSYLEWNYDAEIFAFGKRLGENFKDDVLRKALTHRSYAVVKDEKEGVKVADNYDMIGEGNKIVRDYLTKEFGKNYPELIVKVLREFLTTEKMLAQVGLCIGLKDIILCQEFPIEQKTLADSFCAVISALEMSAGPEVTGKFIKDFLVVQLTGKELFDIWELENAYDHLRDVLKNKEIEPRLCNQSGINTILSNYQVGLYSDKKLIGIGFGESVDIAKNTAALDVLNKMYMKRTSFI